MLERTIFYYVGVCGCQKYFGCSTVSDTHGIFIEMASAASQSVWP